MDAAPSQSYAGLIQRTIRPNINFDPLSTPGNPTAIVEVRTGPNGSIISRRIIQSSGIATYDEAVMRAIDKTATLPRDVDGRVPSRIEIVFRPRD